jgi:Pterin binding enzyme
MMSDPRIDSPVRRVGGRSFDFARHIAVMAIVNRTPDSFYDRGATFAFEAAVAAGHAAVGRGAEIVDVGGVKFAAGPPVPVEEEVARVVPVVHELATAVAVSVDTFHARVARAAIDAGAGVIDDTSGLSDPAMADVLADSDAVRRSSADGATASRVACRSRLLRDAGRSHRPRAQRGGDRRRDADGRGDPRLARARAPDPQHAAPRGSRCHRMTN